MDDIPRIYDGAHDAGAPHDSGDVDDVDDVDDAEADARAAELLAFFESHALRHGQRPRRTPWECIGDRDPCIRLASAEYVRARLRSGEGRSWMRSAHPDEDETWWVTRLIAQFPLSDTYLRDGLAIVLGPDDEEFVTTFIERMDASEDADAIAIVRDIVEHGADRFRLASTRDLDIVAVLRDEGSTS